MMWVALMHAKSCTGIRAPVATAQQLRGMHGHARTRCRFTNSAAQEDLDVLFRVWAVKAYTKCVPLTVQVSTSRRGKFWGHSVMRRRLCMY